MRGLRLRLICLSFFGIALAGSAWAQCSAPANPIVAENCLPGNPASEWNISGSGDPSIQGYATDISVRWSDDHL